jgi:ElaB/YqjD/DUF883 family membrane-anchored ribosome-binding protein
MAETTSKAARQKPDAEDGDVEAQLQAIRAEVAAMAEMMSAFVKEKVHVFGAAAEAAAEEASARARKARDSFQQGVGQAEKVLDHRVQEHPLQSIIMAFGLGMLISLLFRR